MSDKRVFIVGHQSAVATMFKNHEGFSVTLDTENPDLVVFTGGADINPALYSELPLEGTYIDVNRDKQDIEAFKKYQTVPKVGICRGAQFLNVMSGGAMWQHVSNHTRDHVLTNLLKIPDIPEEDVYVTSTHHQMMIPGSEGEEIAITLSDDKTQGISKVYCSANKGRKHPEWDTEIVWYGSTNSLCFQPHPEYRAKSAMTEYFFKLINHFFF